MIGDALSGGRFAQPIRVGDTVSRLMGAGAPNVHALLGYLERQGFVMAPRLLGVTDDRTREILTFLPGATGYPPLPPPTRSERALRSAARTARALHDATAGFVAPEPGIWARQDIAAPATIDCIGHGDLTPWNLIFDGDQVTGIIDFDFAGPSHRAWDLALLAHHLVPLHPTEALAGFGWDHEPDRARRLKILATAYDPDLQPAVLVDYVVLRLLSMGGHIQQQLDAGNPAYAGHVGEPDGYRSAAAYVLMHRQNLLT